MRYSKLVISAAFGLAAALTNQAISASSNPGSSAGPNSSTNSNSSTLPVTPVTTTATPVSSSNSGAEAACETVIKTENVEIRPLSGKLDLIPVLNSNSPEVVRQEGILASTRSQNPHLNYPLKGRFDIFLHHINNKIGQADAKTLYIAVLLENATKKEATVKVLQASSYLSQPDAPFISVPAIIENQEGKIFAGPGDRMTNDFLRNNQQPGWPKEIKLRGGRPYILCNLPIPVSNLDPHLNGRSGLIKLDATAPVWATVIGCFEQSDNNGKPVAPDSAYLERLLANGQLAGPREAAATQPKNGKIHYGRVAGIAIGSIWKALLVDPGKSYLNIPGQNEALAYPLSTVALGTLGGDQIQSAPLAVRYPETAYEAHGNYGIKYELDLPLHNSQKAKAQVSLSFSSPVKEISQNGHLAYKVNPAPRVFFRGTLKVSGQIPSPSPRFIHFALRQGEIVPPFLTIDLAPGETKKVKVEFLYPPDATPPQVLTIKSGFETKP